VLKCVTKEATIFNDVVVRDVNNLVAMRDSEDEKRIFFFEVDLTLIGWLKSLIAASCVSETWTDKISLQHDGAACIPFSKN